MSADDPDPSPTASKHVVQSQKPAQKQSFFRIPPGLKRIFDQFPLLSYDENELPLRAGRTTRDQHVLYVFSTEHDAKAGRPSFNPSCLRVQTYLKFLGIPHHTAASNNHASPSGALPFLLPAVRDETAALPITGNKLKRWISTQRKEEKAERFAEIRDARYEAYQSLLENPVRTAWLFQLYLEPANQSLLRSLYIAPCSSNPTVQAVIAHQLRQAAEAEISKAAGSLTIVESDILRGVEDAISALSDLLGEEQWFFRQKRPGVFDAGVFAYTHLLLGDGLEWTSNPLGEALFQHENLVRHAERIAQMYY